MPPQRSPCSRRSFPVLLLAGALAACGGGGGGGGGGNVPVPPPTTSPPVGETAFVTTTDFTSGSYSTVNLRDFQTGTDLPSQTGIVESDNDAVYFNNRVYIINRFGFDNISVLETDDLTTAVKQFSTGNGSNPQDMAFVSDSKAYVSLLASNELLVVDPTAATGSEITGTIDLSGFLDAGDSDGLVEASSMARVGRYLFVALQRLDNFVAAAPGLLAVVDTATDTVVDVDPGTAGIQGIALTLRNPVALRYAPDLGKLVIGATAEFGADDGGVELVDPFTFKTDGVLLSEADLGGDVGDVLSVAGAKLYAVTGGFSANDIAVSPLVLDRTAGTWSAAGTRRLGRQFPFVPALALDSGRQLLVPDRTTTAPFLRTLDTFTDNFVRAFVVGLPPATPLVLPPSPPTAFVTTTDFSSGSYSTVNLEDGSAETNLPGQAGIVEADNTAVYFNNRIYILNRFGFDNISVVDVDSIEAVERQFSTGNGSNPQDMAFVSDTKAYVSLLGSNELLIVNPTSAPAGSEIRGTIDLSGFLDPADTDGFVEAAAMAKVGRYLFVALQRLDNFAPAAPSLLAVVDTDNDTLVDVDPATPGVQGIELALRNPVALRYAPDLGRLIVGATATFGTNDGGVELVNPFTFSSDGVLISEAELGGDVGDALSVAGTKLYAVVGGFGPNDVLVSRLTLEPANGTWTADGPRSLGLALPFIPSLALDDARQLLVPDRTTTAPGLRIIDTFTDTVGSPIDVGLPPNAVVVPYR